MGGDGLYLLYLFDYLFLIYYVLLLPVYLFIRSYFGFECDNLKMCRCNLGNKVVGTICLTMLNDVRRVTFARFREYVSDAVEFKGCTRNFCLQISVTD